MPSYWTGISQPANGTSRAPAATWRSCRGVRFSVSVPDIGVRTLAVGAGTACRRLSRAPGVPCGAGDEAVREVGHDAHAVGARGGCGAGGRPGGRAGSGGDVRRRGVRCARRARRQQRVDRTVRALDGAPTSEDAANYQLVGSCASPTGLIAQPVVGRRARWGTWAEFGFAAPANTAISKVPSVAAWPRGCRRAMIPTLRRTTPGGGRSSRITATGNQVGAESCKPGAGPTLNPGDNRCHPLLVAIAQPQMVGRAATFTAGDLLRRRAGPFLLCLER